MKATSPTSHSLVPHGQLATQDRILPTGNKAPPRRHCPQFSNDQAFRKPKLSAFKQWLDERKGQLGKRLASVGKPDLLFLPGSHQQACHAHKDTKLGLKNKWGKRLCYITKSFYTVCSINKRCLNISFQYMRVYKVLHTTVPIHYVHYKTFTRS